MVNGSLIKHNNIIDMLYKDLRDNNEQAKIKQQFYYPKGEIDLILYNVINHQFDISIYEIKCSDTSKNRRKAKKQLNNAKDYLETIFRKEEHYINAYYVYGYNESYKTIRLEDLL